MMRRALAINRERPRAGAMCSSRAALKVFEGWLRGGMSLRSHAGALALKIWGKLET